MLGSWLAIGIDPGRSGGIAAHFQGGLACAMTCDTSDPVLVASVLKYARVQQQHLGVEVLVAIERVTAWSGEGIKSAGTIARTAAVPEAVCATYGLPCVLIESKLWQARTFLGHEKPKERAALSDAYLELARERWPYLSLARKKDKGAAAALWIGLEAAALIVKVTAAKQAA